MGEAQAYTIAQFFERLPEDAEFACEQTDVDECLAELGFVAPFQKLRLGGPTLPECARGGRIPATLNIAAATDCYRTTTARGSPQWMLTLEIGIVPREFVGPVRDALRGGALAALLGWMNDRRQVRFGEHFMHTRRVVFDVASGSIRIGHTETPSRALPRRER